MYKHILFYICETDSYILFICFSHTSWPTRPQELWYLMWFLTWMFLRWGTRRLSGFYLPVLLLYIFIMWNNVNEFTSDRLNQRQNVVAHTLVILAEEELPVLHDAPSCHRLQTQPAERWREPKRIRNRPPVVQLPSPQQSDCSRDHRIFEQRASLAACKPSQAFNVSICFFIVIWRPPWNMKSCFLDWRLSVFSADVCVQ